MLTRLEVRRILPFLIAFSEGKQLEYYIREYNLWIDVRDTVDIQYMVRKFLNFRIKPEPIKKVENEEV